MPYVTIAELKAEGFTTTGQGVSTRLTRLIKLAGQYIEKATHLWFESRPFAPMCVDGSGTDTLHLQIPIITITGIVEDSVAVDLTTVTVYNGNDYPDDRSNPKIVKTTAGGWPTSVLTGGIWSKGYRNVELTGTFGYVESDGSTPEPIKQLAIGLIAGEVPKLGSKSGLTERKRTGIKSETTDGHSYTLSDSLASLAATGALTGVPTLDNIILSYRPPILCKAL